MPQIGILFDIDELGSGSYGFAAYKIFFAVIDPRVIPGCIITDGDTNLTLAGKTRHFCISVKSLDQSNIDIVKDALTKINVKGLLPVTSRFLDECAVKQEPLPLSFRINQSGELVDVEFYEAAKALEECRKNWQQSEDSNPAPQKGGNFVSDDVNIIEVRQKSGFIDIKCPSCGSKCPSFLQADDPILESRTWGADCPSCGRAFNFKVERKT